MRTGWVRRHGRGRIPAGDILFEEMAMQNPWWTGGTVPAEWPG